MLQHNDSHETVAPGKADNTALKVEEAPASESAPAVQEVQPEEEMAEMRAVIETGIARNQRRSRIVAGIFSLITSLIFGLLYVLTNRHALAILGAILCLSLMNVLLENWFVRFGNSFWAHRTREAERAAIRRLLEKDDIRNVGAIIDILSWTTDKGTQEIPLRPELIRMLGRLLPLLNETQVQELGRVRMRTLASWLLTWDMPDFSEVIRKAPRNRPLLLGILHAISLADTHFFDGQGYSESRIQLLPKLAEWAGGQGAGQDPEVQAAASACHHILQEKWTHTRFEKQLLRPSEPTAKEGLLRPALDATTTDPDDLLRPGKNDSDKENRLHH